ncbi:DENN domain-containing protein 2D isoform X1 [Apus apus]|uniref:DENN domain-containing protein 2D isoform X1 n=1 Tax=Apus apus TaxID=8895 RepID=UPI0021F8959E|nr:DENN domain-containing protein 2D isoform X1 [Apus apus]
MAALSSFFRRSLRRPGRREGKVEGSAAETSSSRVPQGKPGERSSLFYSAGQFFFEYLVVVSLKKMSDGHYEPKITYQFPKRENLLKGQKEEEERLLKAIPLFCFPDGNNRVPVTEFTSETFSFVLTNVDGSRKIGYCRRLLPSGRGVRLPEVFCIISCLGCFGLFSKILDEVEKRRQISMAVIYPFMQGLRESPFPAPGKSVTIKSFIPESGTELIELTRPVDAHLEHVEFQALLQRLSPHLILHIFASAVLERRLIFLAEELSVLSQCIHAVAALLYPFTWAHTYIPVVPECLLDTVCCPTPFMVGIQMRHLERVLDQPMEEALIVDLCEGKIIRAVGDEEEILPVKLQNEVLTSLSRHNNNNNVQTSEQVNALVSETFVQFFVRVVGHYASYIKWSKNGSGAFQERPFCKAITSKTSRSLFPEENNRVPSTEAAPKGLLKSNLGAQERGWDPAGPHQQHQPHVCAPSEGRTRRTLLAPSARSCPAVTRGVCGQHQPTNQFLPFPFGFVVWFFFFPQGIVALEIFLHSEQAGVSLSNQGQTAAPSGPPAAREGRQGTGCRTTKAVE